MEGPTKSNNELFHGNEWSLPTDVNVEAEAVRFFESMLEKTGWEEEDIFYLKLSFDEALMNAMKHGNKFDARKKVFVSFSISKNKVYIKIRDEGNGFNPAQVPSPTEGEALTKGSGRGLFLMRSFLTVTYNEKGNEVTMIREKK